MRDFIVETYLQNLQEVGPVEASIGYTTALLLLRIYAVFRASRVSIKKSYVDKGLSEKVQSLLNNDKWKVRIIKITPTYYNAFTYGTSQIYISQPLYNILTERERIAVALHEVSHSKTFDMVTLNSLQSLGQFGSLLASLLEAENYEWIRYGPLPAVFLAHYLASMLVVMYTSRKLEYKSDEFAVKFGYGQDLANAFNKLRKHSIPRKECKTKTCEVFRGIGSLLNSHPGMKDRIERILKKKETYEALEHGKEHFLRVAFKLAKV